MAQTILGWAALVVSLFPLGYYALSLLTSSAARANGAALSMPAVWVPALGVALLVIGLALLLRWVAI